MEWAQSKQKPDGSFEIPDSWVYISHYEALNLLFRIENALRIFVYCVLKEGYGSGWTGLQISTAETESIAIATVTSKRIQQERDFAYLGARIDSPMMYLNSGELIRLIFADTYWPKFAPYLPGKKEILRNKLEEISTIRNSLAHFRPITKDEVDVIKQNGKHVFQGIEGCLKEITSCYKIVATNTQEDWYKTLSTLGNEVCKLSLYESPRAKWIRLEIEYSCPLLSTDVHGTFVDSEVINLWSPAILKLYPGLSKRVIFLSEYMPSLAMPQDKKPQYRKQVSLTFSAKSLKECHAELSEDLKKILSRVLEERDLITNDHLARGELLQADRVYASLRKHENTNYWYMNEDALLSSVPDDAPPEYWGTLGRWGAGFLDTAERYPWMPQQVSKESFPF